MDLPSYKEEKVSRVGRKYRLVAHECRNDIIERKYSRGLGVANVVWDRAGHVHSFLLHLPQK